MSQTPVLKVGAVVLREVAADALAQPRRPAAQMAQRAPSTPDFVPIGMPEKSYEILIVRPKPNHDKNDIPPFMLPRGSRQYYDDEKREWVDARDAKTGMQHVASLENVGRTLRREIKEEAGIGPHMLRQSSKSELGIMDYQSSDKQKPPYPVHWFLVQPRASDARKLPREQLPQDALEVKWATLPDIEDMAKQGDFAAGYLPVIRAALAHLSRMQEAANQPSFRLSLGKTGGMGRGS